jgi:Tol biopolymer transport system component
VRSKRISSNPNLSGGLAHRVRRNFPLVASVALMLFAAGTLAAAKPTPTPTALRTATPTPTPTPVVTTTPTPAGLTGKIAYSCSGICLFNLASGTNTLIAPSGVNAKISPDGTKIVFQGCGGICVMNADGTNPTLVANFGALPAWSPDGNRIAFNSSGIWVMNADGSGLQQLTNHGAWPAWSPATTQPPQIAFSSDLNGSGDDLWSMNLDGSNARQILSRAGEDLDVVWSSSGQIVFGGNVDQKSSYEIFAFNPVTLSLSRLTNSPKQDFEPAASPDGSRIAFSSFRNPAGIYIMNADGSSPQLIIPGGRQPSWGP